MHSTPVPPRRRRGGAGGDRHRLRAGCPGSARTARPDRTEALPARAGDRRRPRGIVVIAIFYSEGLATEYLAAAAALTVAIALMRRRVAAIPAYVVVGAVLWYLVYRSGVHSTIAGVTLGMLTPATPVRGREVLQVLEHRLVRWSAFVAVPVFALANAGVELSASEMRHAFTSRVVWGVILGLVVGKILGISLFTLGAVRLGLARLPAGMRSLDVVGGAALAGIGFTVALFIAGLSLGETPEVLAWVKIGILVASVTAALVGSAVLIATRDYPEEQAELE
ncbi:MAG: Na+/H+ antiporter NhaA [Acidimicrobiia bacterium]|nr:Na+/H+ antiporter NhaA [Acidimicrobiia bacterium]